jgi:DNA-binding CsgD family transcriptional regulator
VAALVADSGVDGAEAFRLTRGNPFLVSQLLEAPEESLTPSVRDAVAARLMRLAPDTRRIVEMLSVVPGRAPAALLADDWAHLDVAAVAGLVEVNGRWAQFRHELVRLAVEQELATGHARELHADVLRRMAGVDDVEPAAVAYHARRANDRQLAFTSERAAAERAVELRSHREAVAHYRRAIADADEFVPAGEQAELWLALSRQEHLVGHDRLATEAARRAVHLIDPDDDPVGYGAALRWLGRVTPGEAEAHRLAVGAVTILEPLGQSAELAAAYAYLAANRMIARELNVAAAWARRALDLAERVGDTESRVVALQALGVALTLDGRDPHCRYLRQAVQLCLDTGMDFELGRAYANLVAAPGEARLYDASCTAAEEALAYFVAEDLDGHAGYTRAWHARCLFEQGKWPQAAALVDELLDGCFQATANTAQGASYVRGRLRARRGETGAWSDLDRAKALADASGSIQRVGPVAAARAEARWLAGEPDDGTDGLRAAYELALARTNPAAVGQLGLWMWRHGLLDTLPEIAAEPFRRHVAGDFLGAGQAWLDLGCPYEAADAWAEAADEESVRNALEIFTGLGARPARQRAARRLRELGVRSIPRGPRQRTAADPDGLTAREQEVLSWLRLGRTDAEIAAKLHLSVKTVGHHVSAVLRKTGSRSRRELLSRAPEDVRPRAGR